MRRVSGGAALRGRDFGMGLFGTPPLTGQRPRDPFSDPLWEGMMGYGNPERRCPKESRGVSRWLKRVARRWMRLAWKRQGEDAPRKVPKRGWSL